MRDALRVTLLSRISIQPLQGDCYTYDLKVQVTGFPHLEGMNVYAVDIKIKVICVFYWYFRPAIRREKKMED